MWSQNGAKLDGRRQNEARGEPGGTDNSGQLRCPACLTLDVGKEMKLRRTLVGTAAAVGLFVFTAVVTVFAPRSSLGFFSLVAIPTVALAYGAEWHRRLVGVIVIVGIAILAASPIDFVLTTYEEKKGIYVLPLEYGLGGGIDAGYYSPGCIVPPGWTYSARYVVLLSV